jgi:hypothetical protein
MATKTEWAEMTGLEVHKGLSLGRKPHRHKSLTFSLTGEFEFLILRGPETFFSSAIVYFLIATNNWKAIVSPLPHQISFTQPPLPKVWLMPGL